ncbi:hypothetical protein HMI54_010598 [Coelomomyces lativittatus]|nr:hypothetical protein HMI54_010598 [Coelomomyces lativittatus]KAJ1501177.1 hypothetical protein HMI55_003521 [Coelomomyces lativittatus]
MNIATLNPNPSTTASTSIESSSKLQDAPHVNPYNVNYSPGFRWNSHEEILQYLQDEVKPSNFNSQGTEDSNTNKFTQEITSNTPTSYNDSNFEEESILEEYLSMIENKKSPI